MQFFIENQIGLYFPKTMVYDCNIFRCTKYQPIFTSQM